MVTVFAVCKYTEPYPKIHRYEEEKYFLDPNTGQKIPFPSIEDNWSVNISVIVPAYNEEIRCEHFSMFVSLLNNISNR